MFKVPQPSVQLKLLHQKRQISYFESLQDVLFSLPCSAPLWRTRESGPTSPGPVTDMTTRPSQTTAAALSNGVCRVAFGKKMREQILQDTVDQLIVCFTIKSWT